MMNTQIYGKLVISGEGEVLTDTVEEVQASPRMRPTFVVNTLDDGKIKIVATSTDYADVRYAHEKIKQTLKEIQERSKESPRILTERVLSLLLSYYIESSVRT